MTAARKVKPRARYWWSIRHGKIFSGPGFVTYWLFVSVFHCIFMIYPRTANGMSWRSLYLWETRESGGERMEQKQENRVIDLIWILLSAVRVMMMMWVPVRIQAWSHEYTGAVTHSKCAHIQVHARHVPESMLPVAAIPWKQTYIDTHATIKCLNEQHFHPEAPDSNCAVVLCSIFAGTIHESDGWRDLKTSAGLPLSHPVATLARLPWQELFLPSVFLPTLLPLSPSSVEEEEATRTAIDLAVLAHDSVARSVYFCVNASTCLSVGWLSHPATCCHFTGATSSTSPHPAKWTLRSKRALNLCLSSQRLSAVVFLTYSYFEVFFCMYVIHYCNHFVRFCAIMCRPCVFHVSKGITGIKV